ncbi:MAG: hypothetical protein ACK4IX_01315, partial [Candidatus Sericytochromatia bacterium]
NRLITLTEDFLKGFNNALYDETKDASGIVLETCGKFWGKGFIKKFREEIKSYHGKDLSEIPMFTVNILFQDLWKKHGWGKITINWKEAFETGIFSIEVENSVFSEILGSENTLSDQIFQGFFSSVFSDILSKQLDCFQTEYKEYGLYSKSTFILAIPERTKDVQSMVEGKKSHDEILSNIKGK